MHDFLLNGASDEQFVLGYKIAIEQHGIPQINPILPVSGSVFVSMPMNTESTIVLILFVMALKQQL